MSSESIADLNARAQAKAQRIAVRLLPDGFTCTLSPAGYLGGDRFAAFRTAVEGAQYDPDRKCQTAPVNKVAILLGRLQAAGFALEIDPALASAVQRAEAERVRDLEASTRHANRVDAELRARGLALYPFQKLGVEWMAKRSGGLLADEMGLGKEHAIDTRVMSPSGWRTIGRLEIGDYVIGSNGKKTRVTGVFPQGVKASYRVHFSDHSSVEAGAEHLWTVRYRRGGGKGSWTDLTLTTDDLRLRPIRGKLDLAKTALYLPMLTAPIEFKVTHMHLPLDGYTVGALIANGGLTNGSCTLTFNTADLDVIRSKVNLGSYRTHGNVSTGTVVGAVEAVRQLELSVLSGEKFIPRAYLLAPIPERISLLQALFDGDGSCTAERSRVIYHTTSLHLANNVVELVEGLGGLASIRTYDRSHEDKPTEYQIRTRLPEGILPFSVPRKANRYNPGSHARPCRTVTKVEYVRDVESVCIAVEAEDRLYVTEHCILTHNTIQTIVALPEMAPVLVVCPALVKGVWKRELAKWRPDLRVTVLAGRGSFRFPEAGEVVITNYDVLPETFEKVHGDHARGFAGEQGFTPAFEATCPEGLRLVGDEIHMVKSTKAARSIRFRCLSALVRRRGGKTFGLTGTPLLNRAPELWSTLVATGVAQEAFGNYKTFESMCGGSRGHFGVEWGPIPDPELIGKRLERVMVRRLRSEVLPELPTKTYEMIPVEIKSKKAKQIDLVLGAFDGYVANGISATLLGSASNTGALPEFSEFSKARASLAEEKIPAMMQIVEDYEEQQEPLVVFSAHRAPIDMLSGRDGWAVITGDTSPARRTEIEESFQRGELRGIGATIKAGGVGITLTRSAHVLFVDQDPTPALNAQAEDRICRIGQTRGCVVKVLVADCALDRRIADLLAVKRALIEATVEQGRRVVPVEVPEMSEGEWAALIRDARREEDEANEQSLQEIQGRRPVNPTHFPPMTDLERWAFAGLRFLSAADPDGARELNGAGFNKVDGAIGHSLAFQTENGLTPKQWELAIALCRKYRRQIGDAP